MDLEKRLQEIKEHFANITVEEFKENLKIAGYGTIDSCEIDGMELKPIELIKEAPNYYIVSSLNITGYSEFLDFQIYELGDAA